MGISQQIKSIKDLGRMVGERWTNQRKYKKKTSDEAKYLGEQETPEVKEQKAKKPKSKRTIKREKPWYQDATLWLISLSASVAILQVGIDYATRKAPPRPWLFFAFQGTIAFVINGVTPAVRRLADPDIRSGNRKLDSGNEPNDEEENN